MKAGLAGIGSSGGTLIAFSTAPGRVAEDGKGDNSTFTMHLVGELRKGGEIEQVFKRVRIGVHNDTAGKQEPWVNASLNSNLYLRPAADVNPPAAEAPVVADDEQKRSSSTSRPRRRSATRNASAWPRSRTGIVRSSWSSSRP